MYPERWFVKELAAFKEDGVWVFNPCWYLTTYCYSSTSTNAFFWPSWICGYLCGLHTYKHAYIYTYTYMHGDIHAYTNINACVHICIRIYISIYAHMQNTSIK